MDPLKMFLSVAGVLVVLGIVAAATGYITYRLTRRGMASLGDVADLKHANARLAERCARLDDALQQQQAWTEKALLALRDQRIEDLAAVAEKLHDLSTPAGVARLALPVAPELRLTDDLTDSGASLFDALVSETHLVPVVGDLTMSMYTRTEATELVEMLHAGAGARS